MLGQCDWREHPYAQSGDLRPGGGADIHVRVIDREGELARSAPASSQVNRTHRHDPGHRSTPLNGDPLTFDLLIEERRHAAGYPSQRQIAILPDVAHDVSRLVERADHQPLDRSATELETGVAGSVTGAAGEETKHRVHHGLLVSADRRERGQSSCQDGEVRLSLRRTREQQEDAAGQPAREHGVRSER